METIFLKLFGSILSLCFSSARVSLPEGLCDFVHWSLASTSVALASAILVGVSSSDVVFIDHLKYFACVSKVTCRLPGKRGRGARRKIIVLTIDSFPNCA